MPSFSDNPDSWDTYHTLVDNCPAAITLDLSLGESAPLDERSSLLAVFVHMNEPGEHGMGDGLDPEALRHVEQQVVHAFEDKLDALFVGRVRSQGVWQLYFYCSQCEDKEREAHELLSGFSGWRQELHIHKDPDWETYFELLYPSRERLQWIQDRNVCEALAERGDSLTLPRRVDHFAYFSTTGDRQRFIDSIAEFDFEVVDLGFDTREEEFPFTVQFQRTQSVDLECIHEAVMAVLLCADDHDGQYEGWETCVIVEEGLEAELLN